MTEDERRAQLLRQFQAVIAGVELDDLRALTAGLSRLGAQAREHGAPPRRPELGRRPLPGLHLFRIRVDLRGARPPIWRRLEVRCDLTLDVLHRVLQAAFGWADSHLWRFSIGGDPFDDSSQLFLCPWDEEEGEGDDEGGIPASTVRLDEAIQAPGDVLSYVYDYGDNWELTVRLEHVEPAVAGASSVVALDGRRAAPPEDCGGRRTADDLAEILDDPASFDLDEINVALRSPFIVLREHGLDRRLVALIDRLTYSPVGEDLASRALSLLDERPRPGAEALRARLRPFIWLLDRAALGGIPLTASGYLTPADVTVLAELLPDMRGWIGKANREGDARPVLHFRKALQSLGLIRRHKGTLQLTRAGRQAQADPRALWEWLAARLLPTADGFDADATLLLLVYAGTSPASQLPFDTVADALNHLGWQTADRRPIVGYDLSWLPAVDVLHNVAPAHPDRGQRRQLSVEAAELARAALRTR